MAKYKFSSEETFAVWRNNYERCWLCHRPVTLDDCTIDHLIPESLLDDDSQRAKVFDLYGLDVAFDINSFENWLPAHNWCNTTKSNLVLEYSSGMKIVMQKLRERAPRTAAMAANLKAMNNKGRVLGPLGAALTNGSLKESDFSKFLLRYGYSLRRAELSDEILLLSNGKWIFVKDIRREGICLCERDVCVDSNKKIYCYFGSDLSEWVIGAGLYYKCYDEYILCHRCGENHKRGHIGREGICGRPYLNQELQSD